MFSLLSTVITAISLAFLDISFSRLCQQPFIFCSLAYYFRLLTIKGSLKELFIVFFIMILLTHFLYGNEVRFFWYLAPLTLIGSYSKILALSRRWQPCFFLTASMIAHRLIVDHMTLSSIFSWHCTTLFSLGTLILVVLISLK